MVSFICETAHVISLMNRSIFRLKNKRKLRWNLVFSERKRFFEKCHFLYWKKRKKAYNVSRRKTLTALTQKWFDVFMNKRWCFYRKWGKKWTSWSNIYRTLPLAMNFICRIILAATRLEMAMPFASGRLKHSKSGWSAISTIGRKTCPCSRMLMEFGRLKLTAPSLASFTNS